MTLKMGAGRAQKLKYGAMLQQGVGDYGAVAGELAGNLIKERSAGEGVTYTSGGEAALTSGLKGAQLGAKLGSVIPGLGTGVGVAAGAIGGAAYGLVNARKQKEAALKEANRRYLARAEEQGYASAAAYGTPMFEDGGKVDPPGTKKSYVAKDRADYEQRRQAYSDSLNAYNTGLSVARNIGRRTDTQYGEGNSYEKAFTTLYKNPNNRTVEGSQWAYQQERQPNSSYAKEAWNHLSVAGSEAPMWMDYTRQYNRLNKLKVQPASDLRFAEGPGFPIYKRPTQPVETPRVDPLQSREASLPATGTAPQSSPNPLSIRSRYKLPVIGTDMGNGWINVPSQQPSRTNAPRQVPNIPKYREQYLVDNPEAQRYIQGNRHEKGGTIGSGLTKLSEQEEGQFQQWRQSLPQNLQEDNELYDLRGAWKAQLEPRLEADNKFHLGSRDPYTDRILKNPAHSTFRKAIQADRDMHYIPQVRTDGQVYTTPAAAGPQYGQGVPVRKKPTMAIYGQGGAVPVFRKGGSLAVVLGGQSHDDSSTLGKGNPIIKGNEKVAETESEELLLSKEQTKDLLDIVKDYHHSRDEKAFLSLGKEMKTILDDETADHTGTYRKKRNKPVLKEGGMVQLNGRTGEAEAVVYGGERIFSREDTARFFRIAEDAEAANGLEALGRAVYEAIDRQDKRAPEYTN